MTSETTPDIASRLVEGEPVCSGEKCPRYYQGNDVLSGPLRGCSTDGLWVQACAPGGPCIPGLRLQRDAHIKERDAAKRLLEGICDEFERAIAEADNCASGRKGMQVPCHCDFVSAIKFPSVVAKMRWWVREFRTVLV